LARVQPPKASLARRGGSRAPPLSFGSAHSRHWPPVITNGVFCHGFTSPVERQPEQYFSIPPGQAGSRCYAKRCGHVRDSFSRSRL